MKHRVRAEMQSERREFGRQVAGGWGFSEHLPHAHTLVMFPMHNGSMESGGCSGPTGTSNTQAHVAISLTRLMHWGGHCALVR